MEAGQALAMYSPEVIKCRRLSPWEAGVLDLLVGFFFFTRCLFVTSLESYSSCQVVWVVKSAGGGFILAGRLDRSRDVGGL